MYRMHTNLSTYSNNTANKCFPLSDVITVSYKRKNVRSRKDKKLMDNFKIMTNVFSYSC